MCRFFLDPRRLSLRFPSFFHSTRYHFCSWWSILKQKRNTLTKWNYVYIPLNLSTRTRQDISPRFNSEVQNTHTLSVGYCLGCQKHYVDGLARSLLVSPSGIFVSISGSLSMHWTCSHVLHLSDGQAREKSVWYILTATTSSSFVLTDTVKSFFPLIFNDNFSG